MEVRSLIYTFGLQNPQLTPSHETLNGSKSYLINYKLLPTTNEQATKVIDSNEPIIKYEIAFDPNVSVSSKFSSDCIELIIIYCSDSNYYCGGTDTAHGCYQTTTISCGGGGSEIGSSPDSSGGNAGSGVLTSPVGTNPHGGAGGNSSTQPPQTPCETLSAAIQDPKVAQAIQALKPKTLTKFESAYEITRKYNLELQQYVYDTKLKGGDGFNATVQVGGYRKGNVHNHTIYAQSIPSIGDAHWSMECQEGINPTTAIGYNRVVCPNPVSPLDFETTLLYSLTVDNLTTLTNQINAIFGANFDSLTDEEKTNFLDKLNDKYAEKFATVQNSSVGMEKKFLESYANFGLSLYKFDKNTNKWSKLVLQNNTVTEQPCEE